MSGDNILNEAQGANKEQSVNEEHSISEKSKLEESNSINGSFDWPSSKASSIQSAVFKQANNDFFVDEQLSFPLTDEGEHCFVLVEKSGANTQWIAKKLANSFSVPERAVGYAGLKDRHAVTRQWFSVYTPGQTSPEHIEGDDEFKVLEIHRHNKKLKQGSVKQNRFVITLRDVKGQQADIEQQLETIKQQGYPNYFGAQRFGHHGNNVRKAVAMLQGKRVKKHQRSMYLSAMRSWFFNQYLALRVKSDSWQTAQLHDRMQLAGSRSFFQVDGSETDLPERLEQADIHVAGPMPGEDFFSLETLPEADKLAEIWAPYFELVEKLPVKTDWRALRVIPFELQWQWHDSTTLELSFSLPSGCFATGLLSELGHCVDGSALDHK